jgi:hypothetical protein
LIELKGEGEESMRMKGMGWTFPLSQKYKISLTLRWWKPWDKIEFKRSFYLNFERIRSNYCTENVFSYTLALICLKIEFEIWKWRY